MSVKIIAGNWKMHKGPDEAGQFLSQLKETVPAGELNKFMLFLPALTLGRVCDQLKGSNIGWGAQNVHFEVEGAFTGENSAQVLKEIGGTHCLVGHSERRHVFGEFDEWIGMKVARLQGLGITPILCVGETLEQREAGETNDVISRQLAAGMETADVNKPFVVAYEPVWAIGTGKVATPEIAEEAHAHLRGDLNCMSAEKGPEIPILYGGSVKPENAKDLGAQPNIDGFLIGGASLKVDSLVGIYRNSQ